ncbi:3-deoxy-manno-octulosonate cytidylyltransferase [Fusobacterium sp. PH5-44]|uniref:3-deoxy-manno-octulosonate cytidylyltransferase n=1 Tax=unclassified Fusobacterium TaxID=2648384 RepID=UPI003D1FD8AB
MKFLGVIPARYKSTRLEGKPLKNICGYPMIQWVYQRSKLSKLDDIVVATDDIRIKEVVESFGGNAIITKGDHSNGTSRIAEVCEKMKDYDVVINIQGDEPLIDPKMINQLIDAFKDDSNLVMSTLKEKIKNFELVENPNIVKVITDKNEMALYFSRSPIPYPREKNEEIYYKHIGIYGYKRTFVIEYSNMKETLLEKSESLEQLRVLENGYKIKVIETPYKVIGVDTKEDLERVVDYITQNKIDIKNDGGKL